MTENRSDIIRRVARERQAVVDTINQLKKQLEEIDDKLIDELTPNIETLFGDERGKKPHGEATLDMDDVKIKLSKRKSVKYDNSKMIEAGSHLSWEELNEFFKVKFDMGETGYKELEAGAKDSEKFSDVLSRVDDAREVTVSEPKITSVEIKEG